MNQIRRAVAAVAKGESVVIPPRYNPEKDGVCDVKCPRTFNPDAFHKWDMKKLTSIHEKHVGTKGPQTYNKMYYSLRQHFCWYHGWDYYEIPETRIVDQKKRSKLKRKLLNKLSVSKKGKVN